MINPKSRPTPNRLNLKWLVPCGVSLLVLCPAARADLIGCNNPIQCGSGSPYFESSDDDPAYELGGVSDFTGFETEGSGATSGSGSGVSRARRAKFAFGSATAGVLAGSAMLLGVQGGGGSALFAQSGSTSNVDPPVAPVPEPGTISLMVIGLTGLMGAARRKAAGGASEAAQESQTAAE